MPSTVKRQSAAVMFTDIAGYTDIMANDEEKALSLLQEKRSVLKPLIDKHDGVYVKGTGDGTLSYFDSAYKASKCAKLFQESIYDNENMNVRVGIHVGDIVFDDGDVYGDGVNVASRLESMSPVGGICVSNTVYDELRNKKGFDGVELGLQSLKGVGRLIEIYGLKGDLLTEPTPSDYQDNKVTVHSDDEVPSIAIIPFDNKGADKDVFYAYGISADLISDCSGAGLIRVASLKDVEKLDYNNLETAELSEKLLVRYIAQGTLWKMDNMFQLSVELYDTKDKKIVWADRWQEKWVNLSSIQGNLSKGLLQALNRNRKLTKIKETTNTTAYEYYLQAKHRLAKRKSRNDLETSRGLLEKAIELDDNFMEAKYFLGESYQLTGEQDKAEIIFNSSWEQAKRLDNQLGVALSLTGLGDIFAFKGEYERAIEKFNQALIKFESVGNKNSVASQYMCMGVAYHFMLDLDKAKENYYKGMQIKKELNDEIGIIHGSNSIGYMHADLGDFQKGLDWHYKALKLAQKVEHQPGIAWAYNGLAHDKTHFGHYDEAIEYLQEALNIRESIDDKYGEVHALLGLGYNHLQLKNYQQAILYLERAKSIIEERGIDRMLLLSNLTFLSLGYKKMGGDFDKVKILKLVDEVPNYEYPGYFELYRLLEDKLYLNKAYEIIQKLANNLEPDVKARFLTSPIVKAIVEEWEKVTTVKN